MGHGMSSYRKMKRLGNISLKTAIESLAVGHGTILLKPHQSQMSLFWSCLSRYCSIMFTYHPDLPRECSPQRNKVQSCLHYWLHTKLCRSSSWISLGFSDNTPITHIPLVHTSRDVAWKPFLQLTVALMETSKPTPLSEPTLTRTTPTPTPPLTAPFTTQGYFAAPPWTTL